MKFHKLWNTYYLNRFEKSFEKYSDEYKLLDEHLINYKTLDFDSVK